MLRKLNKDSYVELKDLKFMRHNLKKLGYDELTIIVHKWIVAKKKGESIKNIFPKDYKKIIKISKDNDLFIDKS